MRPSRGLANGALSPKRAAAAMPHSAPLLDAETDNTRRPEDDEGMRAAEAYFFFASGAAMTKR
jgi:hypothetical protein